ncbi:MAG: SUMF1/EgtB/PvdO family nonheme iron enzyme [Myxococcales bacterium]
MSPILSAAVSDTNAIRSQEDCPERMIFIPGGKLEFVGPIPGDKDKTPKKQAFEVRPFCIDEFEARNLDWDSARSGGSIEGTCGKRDPRCILDARVNGPATCVTPEQAECYCANILPGIPKRLPTDQEFLFAALGTDGRLFPWGNEIYPGGQWGATPDFCSFEPNEEPKTHICAPWQNTRDRSPFGVIGMATNGGEMTLLSSTPKRLYALRGVSHASQDTDPDSIGLARWPGVVSEPARGGPFLSFRCVISKRAGG